MNKSRAIVMKAKDNVATAAEEILAGSDVLVNIGSQPLTIHVVETIPFGHKFAIKNIQKDEKIIKYGEVIGEATADIQIGQHTHVHNLIGCRGRGDLQA